MFYAGSNFGERREDEFANEHARMRNLQFRRFDGLVTVEENIQVDQARTFRNEFLATHAGFDSAQRAQQIQRW